MIIKKLRSSGNGLHRFDLSIGGFVVKNCRWYPSRRQILFPLRYDKHGRVYRVVFTHGAQVKRLRALLESGQGRTPRDRRPCELAIRPRFISQEGRFDWYLFDFTVRGFAILGCRWQPDTGSIQLPVTFRWYKGKKGLYESGYRKTPVVCAYGAHVNRLRAALATRCPVQAALYTPKAQKEMARATLIAERTEMAERALIAASKDERIQQPLESAADQSVQEQLPQCSSRTV